ncbi:MAG TPA: branched-chain amino acid ABC transporter permease [Mycobacteriales bacterium]|nr:branched-chain amino acid ABC transporter permease [Mycobacteriales bacterium]
MNPLLLAPTVDTQAHVVAPLVNGLFTGCAYGLVALGLVLLYRSSRIFNFAQGEFASVGAFVASAFITGEGFLPKLPYPFAMIGGVVAAVLIALVTERAVVQPLFSRPRVVLVVGTVGVALLLIALEGIVFPGAGRLLPPISKALGTGDTPFKVDGIRISSTNLLELGALVTLGLLSVVFFRFSALGTAILAVSQDVTAARVVGISVSRVSMLTWGLAGFLAGVGGVVVGSDEAFLPGKFTGLVLVPAFAAAVLGGMTSMPGAFLGGILLGEVQAFGNADGLVWPGLRSLQGGQAELLVFLVVLVVLLVRPRGLLGKDA